MQFCDLKKQYSLYKQEIRIEMDKVLDSAAFIGGPDIAEMEKELADFCGATYALGVSSGSDAIILSLLALGVKPGDEIIVPAFTFIATASMVSHIGAVPVFADVDPITFNITPESIEKNITSKTKGIIAVSLFGQCADFDAIDAKAREHGIFWIEDGAQSFGAVYKNKKSCAVADISTTSFFPAKPLGAYGDGGAVFTQNESHFHTLKLLRNHGQSKRYHHDMIGLNARLDTLQAVVIRVKLRHFADELKAREQAANYYSKNLKEMVETPVVLNGRQSVWAQYTIRLDRRDELKDVLNAQGIPTAVHYPMPLHTQSAFSKESLRHPVPVSEKLAARVMSLPMHPFLTKKDQDIVIEAVKNFFKS